MKRFFLSLCLLILSSLTFARDYQCSFTYKVAGKTGTGSSAQEVIPVVTVNSENKTVTLPDFIFSSARTIKSFTIIGVDFYNETEFSASHFETVMDSKKITVKNLKGSVQNDILKMTLSLKIGKMPFFIFLEYNSL